MNVCNISELRPLLERHGFNFSKALGQNFLTDATVPRRIAELGGLDASCGVLEIGPGVGALTRELCARAGSVVACEMDKRLIPLLGETLEGLDNIELINADILKLDIGALAREKFSALTSCAFANLPYYITTPVLQRLIEADVFSRIVVMVQKEVAARMTAAPGTPDYGALTVFVGFYYRASVLFSVPPSSFVPAPKVHSAVVRLDAREERPVQPEEEDMFFRVVRASFGQRRKTLANGLSSAFPTVAKESVIRVIENCGLDARVRGETLGTEKFAQISRGISTALAEKQKK